jgi:hypothetical protein
MATKSVARRSKILESSGDVRASIGEQLRAVVQALHKHCDQVARAGKDSASSNHANIISRTLSPSSYADWIFGYSWHCP